MVLDRLASSRSTMALSFRPVDVAAQARRHRLVARAREDGQRNWPPTEGDDQALAEREIDGEISAERDRCANLLAANLRAQRDALSRLQTGMDVARIRQSAEGAIAKLNEVRASWSGDVADLRRRAEETQAEFDAFKKQHSLVRGARLPENAAMSKAILIMFVVIEAGANAFFFAGGSEQGLLGGFMLAVCLSLINVGSGVVSGMFLIRMVFYDHWLGKLVGGTLFTATAAVLVVFNGIVAHYRDLYQMSGDATDVHLALFNMRFRTLDLDSLYSWLLLAAGLFFFGAAVRKGFQLDDPFPGYGQHERRRQAARESYLAARDDLIKDAIEIRDDFSLEAGNVIETLRASDANRQQTLGGRAHMLSEFKSVEANLEEAAHQLLSIYRQENVATRTTPPPAHFSKKFVFRDRAMDRPEFKMLLTDQGLEHDADTLIDELDGLRRRVHDEHAMLLAQVPGGL